MIANNEIPLSTYPVIGSLQINNDLSPTSAGINLQKDSQWLTLEICREHLRNKCQRNDSECKFAHPPRFYPMEIHHGRVICCYDYIKGKCNRKSPPCKYLHPPQHLREQLLQNGRNNLIVKNIQYSIIKKQLQSNPYYVQMTPFQLSNFSHSLQQTSFIPPTTMGTGTNLMQCVLPFNFMSPYTGDFQFNYNIVKDNLMTSKPSSLLTTRGIIPGMLIQQLPPNVTTETYNSMLSNGMSTN